VTVEINFIGMLHRVRAVEEGAKDKGPVDKEKRKERIEKFHKDTAKPQGRYGNPPAGMIRVGMPMPVQHKTPKEK
jgi:hypothetical protein